jgi:hypothetical protein
LSGQTKIIKTNKNKLILKSNRPKFPTVSPHKIFLEANSAIRKKWERRALLFSDVWSNADNGIFGNDFVEDWLSFLPHIVKTNLMMSCSNHKLLWFVWNEGNV